MASSQTRTLVRRFAASMAALLALAGCASSGEGEAPRIASTAPPASAPTPAPVNGPATPAAPPGATQAPTAPRTPPLNLPFPTWLDQFRVEALAAGISPAVFDRAMAGVEPDLKLLQLERAQPEFVRPIWEYLASAVSARRISKGQQLLDDNAVLLSRVRARYGVDPAYIVAIWGLESDYGGDYGSYPVLESLATLAWGSDRADAFRKYLLDALWIVQEGDIPASRMIGSWAGAMGQTQFMPSTFRSYAVDFNGDGRRDIWSSLPDVFASTANYLSSVGWRPGAACYEEVRLPMSFPWELADLDHQKSVAEWQGLGARPVGGQRTAAPSEQASLLLPAGYKGPAFLVFDNFRAIMRYNNSTNYALAVCHLAERLQGGGPILGAWPIAERPLSRSERFELQRLLADHGYLNGPVDGLIGPITRAAVRTFQQQAGLPADGYPTVEMLDRLRAWRTG